ncbi:MAG TPA: hypothetical protein VL588_07255 [Bdellovibrionota bacterium]|jgi:hypothetical protein|nr:hypothetical protein [Bdellovibrionota bacterium]
MRKNLIALAATMIAGLSAQAQAKQIDLTDDVLAKVTSVQDGQARLRVYLNRTLIVERETTQQTSVDVHSDVTTSLQKKELRETIKRGVRGKIVAIEGDNGEANAKTIFITFSPSCNDKSCAWGFTRAHDHTYSSYSYGYYNTYSNDPAGNRYLLSALPAPAGAVSYDNLKVFSKKGLLKRKMTTDGVGLYETDPSKYSIKLQANEEELFSVIHADVNYPGVN